MSKEFKKNECNYVQLIESLRNRTELLELIIVISTTFISLKSEETDKEIEIALELICEYSGFDSGYIFMFSDNWKIIENKCEWCSEKIEPINQNLKEISVDRLPWLMDRIKILDIIYIPNITNLPSTAGTEKDFFESRKVRSSIIIPMSYEDSIAGFLGFDSMSPKTIWSEENILLLQIVSKIFISALKCKQTEIAILKNRELPDKNNNIKNVKNTQGTKLSKVNKKQVESLEKESDEIKISYDIIKDYLEEFENILFTKDSFAEFKFWLYKFIHMWIRNYAKNCFKNYENYTYYLNVLEDNLQKEKTILYSEILKKQLSIKW